MSDLEPMISCRVPSAMSPAKRRAEVAELLAAGYIRLLVRRAISSRELEDNGESEAPCGQAVNAKQKPPGKEHA